MHPTQNTNSLTIPASYLWANNGSSERQFPLLARKMSKNPRQCSKSSARYSFLSAYSRVPSLLHSLFYVFTNSTALCKKTLYHGNINYWLHGSCTHCCPATQFLNLLHLYSIEIFHSLVQHSLMILLTSSPIFVQAHRTTIPDFETCLKGPSHNSLRALVRRCSGSLRLATACQQRYGF